MERIRSVLYLEPFSEPTSSYSFWSAAPAEATLRLKSCPRVPTNLIRTLRLAGASTAVIALAEVEPVEGAGRLNKSIAATTDAAALLTL